MAIRFYANDKSNLDNWSSTRFNEHRQLPTVLAEFDALIVRGQSVRKAKQIRIIFVILEKYLQGLLNLRDPISYSL